MRVRLVTVAAFLSMIPIAWAQGGYAVVDTGQTERYGDAAGQDAEYAGNEPAYRDEGDGTVTDLVTGLVWQKTPDFERRTHAEALEYADGMVLAGKDDWRLPSIEELVSIVDFRGNQHSRTAYLDERAFDFEWPEVSEGVRSFDAQYWSRDRYLGRTMGGDRSAFGFNFADGRVKSYPYRGNQVGRLYVRCVRGAAYGANDFADNGDGTVTDRATELTWTRKDAGRAMDWEEALVYAEGLEFAGHDDWRLPNAKELYTLVDVTRAPDAEDGRARGPAIDPVFETSDPAAWYWTSTTHVENGFGYYVCFGRALSRQVWEGKPVDAHGAGAMRSDPKTGDPSAYADGFGPQDDEIRIDNAVRCVRGGKADRREAPAARVVTNRWILRLDRDGDGRVSREEFDGPGEGFDRFDADGDGFIAESEAPSRPPR